jgi:hypothetical protein
MEPETKKPNWHERVQKILQHAAGSNKISMAMYGIGILLVVIIIFQMGMIVGRGRESVFSEQQERYLIQPLPTAHGTAGKIISINLPTILVADEDHTEKIVVLRDETIIRSLRTSLLPDDLDLDDYIIVIGTPTTKGHIQANLIRVLPQN